MFEELSARFEDAVKGLRGQAKISDTNVEDALKQVRRALLGADVSLEVVREFVEEVRQKAVGAEVVRGVTPDQKFVQVVHQQLVEVMGGDNAPMAEAEDSPTVVLMAGLQGAGKTTATAKLGLHLKDQGQRPLMVAADVYRPAAIDQLRTLGEQIGVDVFSLGDDVKPEQIAAAGLAKAREEGFDTLLVDTAGRLQIDTEMMEEMVRIRSAVEPDEVLLVVDSMIGQEAAELTRAFHDKVGITGSVLTKLDGDSRGGAALSIRKVSGQPIKFIGTGEKVEALQPFHPERMASRILGMGDVLTLVEKAQKEVELADVEKMQKKLQEASFDFSDFLQQMRLIKRMGSLGGLIKMMPGMNKLDDGMLKQGEQQLKRIEAMIGSMTADERNQPELLASQPSRRRRIARGSGHSPADVDKVLADFQKMRGFMQQMSKGGGMPGMGGGLPGMGGAGGGMPGMGGAGMPEPASGGRGGGSPRRQRPVKKKKGFGEL
ncbi:MULTISPECIES: signal recognition particle protein [Prochlorococcus]|uniref:signal recognition particle protein n=1 Tax=Prochlorococcus TaxID=1218 RepID=UPI0007B3D3E1|nr:MULTISPECIES: signal recognition particle protein [Prochlorococcus]KZR67675.1 Signal recognition particle protein [Prochlorococcus marinus str. MIT 1312]KZR84266.1 Signal recognition particle protein [Prochlorococcus marinus str. MIT 1327]NMO84547.1 signal recognition particle protein [Prochlorococcus sp. P1344]NMP05961.1 signal recognition particle protein [Prochlorococcus sp. P1361]NMP13134.1 signal recognition particle protein [Prochlorococcus sp.P1363]